MPLPRSRLRATATWLLRLALLPFLALVVLRPGLSLPVVCTAFVGRLGVSNDSSVLSMATVTRQLWRRRRRLRAAAISCLVPVALATVFAERRTFGELLCQVASHVLLLSLGAEWLRPHLDEAEARAGRDGHTAAQLAELRAHVRTQGLPSRASGEATERLRALCAGSSGVRRSTLRAWLLHAVGAEHAAAANGASDGFYIAEDGSRVDTTGADDSGSDDGSDGDGGVGGGEGDGDGGGGGDGDGGSAWSDEAGTSAASGAGDDECRRGRVGPAVGSDELSWDELARTRTRLALSLRCFAAIVAGQRGAAGGREPLGGSGGYVALLRTTLAIRASALAPLAVDLVEAAAACRRRIGALGAGRPASATEAPPQAPSPTRSPPRWGRPPASPCWGGGGSAIS